MTLQQIKYLVSALAIGQLVITLAAIFLIIKNVAVGIRERDHSKYRKAVVVIAIAFGLFVTLGIIQFFILLE